MSTYVAKQTRPGSDRFNASLAELAEIDKSDLAAALRILISVDAQTMDVSRVSYWELTPSSIVCRLLYERDADAFSEGGELRATEYPAYFRALLESRAIVADDAWTDRRTAEFVASYFQQHDIRSMLDIPVWQGGKLVGVLCHEQTRTSRTWTWDEQAFALGIANMISVSLEARDRRRAEEGYALVARAAHDVLWDWDMKRNVIEWNDALRTIYGYQPEAVAPELSWWLDRVHPDDRDRIAEKLAELKSSDASVWQEQYRWIRADGRVAIVLDRGYLIRDEQRVPIRMVGTMVDITERMEMQARLALSDRMASLGTLAAGVAHEINNPLAYVVANLALAQDRLQHGSDDRVEMLELLGEAAEGAERIRRIVRDLQLFSRPREDEVENVDVQAVIESSLNIAWNELRHRARIERQFGPVPEVRMNRARLGQVILNLLVNAAHSIKEGNVDGNRIVVRTATAPHGAAVIEVSDTGSGMAPEVRSRIFEPFFTTKPVGIGTGLGLSICHSIVTAAGGRIDVVSQPGSGTTMTIELPGSVRAPVAAAPVAAAPEAADDEPRALRILVVDDDAALRRSVRRMLQPRHDVVSVATGGEALDWIRRGEQFDVILCDLMMPSMPGIAVYNALRAGGSALADRVIFMTGGAFSAESSAFVADCPRPLLEKPIDRADLARALATTAPHRDPADSGPG